MLRAAYFSDFKQGPTFLFWGDAAGMQQLVTMLQRLPPVGSQIELDGFANRAAPKIIFQSSANPSGMQKKSDQLFQWIIGSKNALDFCDMILQLTAANMTGHQYLECGALDEITVMVARDEYPNDLSPN
jgi:hypothetical protein